MIVVLGEREQVGLDGDDRVGQSAVLTSQLLILNSQQSVKGVRFSASNRLTRSGYFSLGHVYASSLRSQVFPLLFDHNHASPSGFYIYTLIMRQTATNIGAAD